MLHFDRTIITKVTPADKSQNITNSITFPHLNTIW